MASRVNKKFVIILTSSLLAVFVVVAGVGWYAYSTRADRNIERGDAAAAAGNYYDAKQFYGRAVASDPTRMDWLNLYHDALLKSTPPNRAEYEKYYDDHIVVMKRKAVLRETDIDHQIEYISNRDRAIRRTSPNSSGYRQIERLVEDATKFIRSDEPKLAVINRYRGLATVDRMYNEVVDEEERNRALNDLEAAARFDPTDHEAALGVAEWHFAEVNRYRRNRQRVQAQNQYEEGMAVVESFLEEHPKDPEANLLKFRMAYQEGNRRAISPLERTQFLDRMKPMYEGVVDVFLEADPSELTIESVEVLAEIGNMMGVSDREPVLAVVDRAMEAMPEELRLRLLKGNLELRMGANDEAIETFQQIVEAPLPPVSLQGRLLPLYKRQALANQVDAALAKHSSTTDPASRQAAIDEARMYRDRLAEAASIREQDMLTLRDAKLAIVDENYQEAVAKFSRAIESGTGDVARNHLLMAHALDQLGNRGEARTVLLDLLELIPGNPQLLSRIAEYDINLDDFESARDRLKMALEGDPNNETIRQRLREVETALDPQSANADPRVAMVITSRKLRDEQKYEEAEAMLKEGLAQFGNEYRLVRELAEVLVRQDRRDEALEVVDAALAESPNNQQLKQVRLVVEEDDPVELGLKLIEMSGSSDVDKYIDKYQVYMRHDRREDAQRMLDKAREINELDERLIDLDFLLALQNSDRAEAQRVIERATESNSDKVGGRLFSARYELVFGDARKAIEILEDVVEDAPRQPAAWLLLGEARMSGGRVQEAVDAFERAYEGRPDDIQIIKAYARALIRVNREAEALELITPSPGLVRATMSDPELVEMWLNLAENYGDRNEVLDMRGELFASDPTIFKFRNAIAYFRMLIEDDRWEEAEDVLAKLSQMEQMGELQLTVLRVNLTEERAGVEPAVDMFASYVDSLDESDETVLPAHLNFGEFLLNRGYGQRAVEVFRESREYQTELLEADRKLGDYFFNTGSRQQSLADNSASRNNQEDSAVFQERAVGMLRQAADFYENIIESGTIAASDLNLVTKRYGETLLKLGRIEEAKDAIARIGGNDDDLELLVLRASIATAEGDRRRARDIYDTAVERFPDRTLPYIQRALFNANNAELIPDAIADLQQAVTLDSGRTQAWVKLYDLRKSLGETDAAFAGLRRAIEANPRDDSLQRLLISELFAAGRREEGLIAALEAVRARPDNEEWLTAVARILAQSERYREASDLYRRLVELSVEDDVEPDPNYVAGLLDMTLQRTDANIPDSQIFELLRRFRPIMDENSVYHLMLESRALTEVEEVEASFEKLKEALAATLKEPEGGEGRFSGALGALWWQQLQLVSTNRDRAYAFLEQQDRQGQLNPYLIVQLQNYKRNEGAEIPPLIDRLDEVLANHPDDLTTRLEALKRKSQFLYQIGEYEMSAHAITEALKITPTDAELNNNIAYIYVEHLQNHEKGLEHAERALARNANSSITLDTLGWAYYHVGRMNEAIERLRRAVQLAQTDAERLPALIHRGFAELKGGSRSTARSQYDQALQIAESNPNLAQQYREKLLRLEEALE